MQSVATHRQSCILQLCLVPLAEIFHRGQSHVLTGFESVECLSRMQQVHHLDIVGHCARVFTKRAPPKRAPPTYKLNYTWNQAAVLGAGTCSRSPARQRAACLAWTRRCSCCCRLSCGRSSTCRARACWLRREGLRPCRRITCAPRLQASSEAAACRGYSKARWKVVAGCWFERVVLFSSALPADAVSREAGITRAEWPFRAS